MSTVSTIRERIADFVVIFILLRLETMLGQACFSNSYISKIVSYFFFTIPKPDYLPIALHSIVSPVTLCQHPHSQLSFVLVPHCPHDIPP